MLPQNVEHPVNANILKSLLIILAFVSFFVLLLLDYDMDFKCIILCPLAYAVSIIILHDKVIIGWGSVFLIIVYAFRMCVLPLLCAYGNFYLEPDKSIYIQNFLSAVLLMCFECLLVFVSLYYYSSKSWYKVFDIDNESSHVWLQIFAFICIFIYVVIFYKLPSFFTMHVKLMVTEALMDGEELLADGAFLQAFGKIYYLMIIMDIVGRPIISFVIVTYLLRRKTNFRLFLAICVGLLNIAFITDRRILSFLVGITCLLQVFYCIKNRNIRVLVYIGLVICALFTVVYAFYGENTPARIARKFQRYFSGPTLTAIGITVYNKYLQTPLSFFQGVSNSSVLLSGVLGTFNLPNYVTEICGFSGKSIWTPMMIGAIQQFHIFAPVLIVVIVRYIVHVDVLSVDCKSDLQRMISNYLTFSMSVYMVMYTIELLYYNLICVGGLFLFLLWLDKGFPLIKILKKGEIYA